MSANIAEESEDQPEKKDNTVATSSSSEANNDAKATAEPIDITSTSPSITVSLLVFWILPILMLSFVAHFAVDTTTPPKPIIPKNRPVSVNLGEGVDASSKKNRNKKQGSTVSSPASAPSPRPGRRSGPKPTPLPSASSNWPTAYKETIDTIQKRGRKLPRVGNKPSSEKVNQPKPVASSRKNQRTAAAERGSPRDPMRQKHEENIDAYRKQHEADPKNIITAVKFADALRLYDVSYHDGGTKQPEAISTYEKAIQMAIAKREKMIENGDETNLSLINTRNVRDEVTMDYPQKSMDGLLCAIYTAKGKVYFMANMFERAVESYTKCLEIEPFYLDALGSRGSSFIILGRYEEAASDLLTTIENDEQNFFNDAFTGLARILQAKEEAVPQGWTPIVDKLNNLIPTLEGMISSIPNPEGKKMIANTLNRLHHVMFTYHDVKTQDTDEAWEHLTQSYKHKMSALPPWQSGFEKQKIQQTMQIFHRGFWPEGVGSDNEVPIFIIGFVRSGSTLLERVLDAHPEIAGTGEDSVFNGRLDKIRNEIVDASMAGDSSILASTVKRQAEEVVAEMKERWKTIEANTAKDENQSYTEKDPRRMVDKMLNNWANVGFIHMLFPKALILHVIREPMDTIFSAFKHEFPPGTLDYTSDFTSLAELYHSYRDLMDHWDKELPGRVTHVRYEDLVHDVPGMAKAIIRATGLEWHDDILDFHKKKHAVNTLSTTQVRKGIYKHSLQSWRKYEEQLQPLVELIGDRIHAERKTTLPGYTPPEPEEDNNTETN